MNPATERAIWEALRLVGHTPDRYDCDAVYGALIERGIHIIDADAVMGQMFDDRCDFECHVCHPDDSDERQ